MKSKGIAARISMPWVVAVIVLATNHHSTAQSGDCCLVAARYWEVPPDAWQSPDRPVFPEDGDPDLRSDDLGVAFSGGGTRSASLTMGQLRGLRQNGWLDHVKYMTAVSGGSWAAVPYAYSSEAANDDPTPVIGLGKPPGQLTTNDLTDETPTLTEAIAESKLFASGLLETALIGVNATPALSVQLKGDLNHMLAAVPAGADEVGLEPQRMDKTYARMLGRAFLKGTLQSDVLTKLYVWNDRAANNIKQVVSGLSVDDFIEVARKRPFLIVGGSLIYDHPALSTSGAIPVEFTPLYTGIRQRFGEIGGTYVWPWAYDPSGATRIETTNQHGGVSYVDLRLDLSTRRLTLADLIATSGAAPAFAIDLAGSTVKIARTKLLAVFPHFNHFDVRGGKISNFVGTPMPHADGGATDDLGLMPLLARHVHNIIVFVNTDEKDYRLDRDLEALFKPDLDLVTTSGFDYSMTTVFPAQNRCVLMCALDRALDHGEPLVYCGINWRVLPNRFFNISPYDGLNICFVYNSAPPQWINDLSWDAKVLQSRQPDWFTGFPWYNTLLGDKPFVIKLHPEQVNMLANLSEWILESADVRKKIERALFGRLR